ncbi:hypothetical protein FOA52_007879 [Chlamydomonas sp. UWO 241]|nr:hypothetical protein FOA52_007879 [Chlamydomonas sp. UWO 241]
MPQLARRDVRNLLLGPGASAGVKKLAAGALARLAINADNQATIAAAGAIPPLVQLLGARSPSDVQKHAAAVLVILAQKADKVAMVAAGAIPPLVLLLRPGADDLPKEFAARVLARLGHNNTKNRDAIAAAGASAGVDVLEKMERLSI